MNRRQISGWSDAVSTFLRSSRHSTLVKDRVPGMEIMVHRQIEQGFSSFFAKFLCKFDDFSKWSTVKVLQNF